MNTSTLAQHLASYLYIHKKKDSVSWPDLFLTIVLHTPLSLDFFKNREPDHQSKGYQKEIVVALSSPRLMSHRFTVGGNDGAKNRREYITKLFLF